MLALEFISRFKIETIIKLEEDIYMQIITLNNGIEMLYLGFGVYQISIVETAEAVYQAIKLGHRLIARAAIYGNEKETTEGMKRTVDDGPS